MCLSQVGENVLAAIRDRQPHGTTIAGAAFANDQPRIDETIDELDDRMVTKHKARRERLHGRLHIRRQAANREQELMLTRLDARLPRRRFRKRGEPAQLMTKLGQRLVVGIGECGAAHWPSGYIASRYIGLD